MGKLPRGSGYTRRGPGQSTLTEPEEAPHVRARVRARPPLVAHDDGRVIERAALARAGPHGEQRGGRPRAGHDVEAPPGREPCLRRAAEDALRRAPVRAD